MKQVDLFAVSVVASVSPDPGKAKNTLLAPPKTTESAPGKSFRATISGKDRNSLDTEKGSPLTGYWIKCNVVAKK